MARGTENVHSHTVLHFLQSLGGTDALVAPAWLRHPCYKMQVESSALKFGMLLVLTQ